MPHLLSPVFVILQAGTVVMAAPGMVYEQYHGIGEPLSQSTPVEVALMCSTGFLGFYAQQWKTLALQISRSLGVTILR